MLKKLKFWSWVRGLLLLISLLAFSTALPAQTAFDPSYWQVLLHYQKGIFGGWHSEAFNPEFFVSPNGRTDPEAELQASLQVIRDRKLIQGQPFECVFPARYHYLKSVHSLPADESPCPRFQKWRDQFAAESVSVIFATSYLGNVASIFGHAFLKVNAKTGHKGPRGELLDLGLSFAAKNDPNDNPLTFAWRGLTGGYLENLTVMTYFTRLAEYHNIENRDVWEYKLNLNAQEVERLLEHVWELRSGQMNYYFADRNCAYHLSVLLEVAHPGWHLLESFGGWAIPSDGIKALAKSGAVSQVKLRPSIYHKLKQKVLAMSNEEKAAFTKSKNSQLALQGQESSLVLESLLDYQQFTIHPFYRDLTPSERDKQNELFAKLTTATIASPALPNVVAASQPDLGHASRKVSLALGSGHDDQFAELEIRPTLHDLLDSDEGYPQFSQVEVARTRLHYSETNHRLDLHNFEVLNIVSLVPVDSLLWSPSWLLQIGALVPPDATCPSCLSGSAQMGGGLSTYLMPRTENAIVFAMLKLNFEDGAGTPGSFRFGPSELFGLDVRLGRSVKFLSDVELIQYLSGRWSAEPGADGSWTSGLSWRAAKNVEFRFNGTYQWLPLESYVLASLAAGFYF